MKSHLPNEGYFFQHRQQWIQETLQIFGYLNVAHLQRKFKISHMQAIRDLNYFREGNPDTIRYNGKTKRLEAINQPSEETKCIKSTFPV